MDKNFIRIDDLVRQHLEGAEEQERAGAWLKMRDLLDEEMPRKKRVGIIYWKRIFGLVAATSLIGTMAVGSYELSSVYRRTAASNTLTATTAPDYSRESGMGNMAVQPAWIGDEPATSGKITVRRSAHKSSTAETANTKQSPDKPYNGGKNSSYMAAVSSAASANAGKPNSGDAANNTNDVLADNASANSETVTNTGNKNNINHLTAVGTQPLSGNKAGIASAVKHSVPATATAKNSTAYNNVQEEGAIRAKRNAGNNSSQNNNASHSGNTNHNNNWQGTVSTSDSRVVPNNPVNDDANRNSGKKVNKTGKNQNTTISNIAGNKHITNTSHGSTGTEAHIAANRNTSNKNSAAGYSTKYNNESLSGSVKARRNGRKGNDIPRIATTTGNTKPIVDTRIADAGTHTVPSGITGNNAASANTHHNQKIGALNAAPATGMPTGSATHKTAATHSASGITASAHGRQDKGGKSAHTGIHTPKDHADNNKLANSVPTLSHTASKGQGESGNIKGHRTTQTTNMPGSTTGSGHSVAKITGTGSNTPQQPTSVLASSARLGKHSTTGKTQEINNDEVANNQETDDTAQKQEGDKKVITKIVLRQREIKNGNETHTQVDTVSMEKFSKQSDAPAEDSDPLSGNVTAKRGANTPTPAAAEPDTDNQPATSEKTNRSGKHRKRHKASEMLAAAPANTAMGEDAPRNTLADAPADNAASTSANPSEIAAKKKNADRKTGASLLQKLSYAFNDVKQNAAGTRFTPGITAGINSNFFGPSKMMGFQFGVTGTFNFNETWSLMSELKYFHRVNNNNIEDNYYSYTDMGNGQYRRELVRNTYDFAALHTMELPLTIRYARGNFNFYAGTNLQYSFSINTAPATTPDPNAQATFVSTPGTDNMPAYTEADFRSRFALGYIFGFSYQVAPNTSLDIRNVQSVWDNAATTGARSVSSMLYRTPSIQLSVMYRLGGNKNKE